MTYAKACELYERTARRIRNRDSLTLRAAPDGGFMVDGCPAPVVPYQGRMCHAMRAEPGNVWPPLDPHETAWPHVPR